jgi:hypothetical protein
MPAILTQSEPSELLKIFYMEKGIAENDLDAKLRVMLENVMVPDCPNAKPALYELELQWFRDRGYSV